MSFKAIMQQVVFVGIIFLVCLAFGPIGCGGGGAKSSVAGDINGDGQADLVIGSGNWNDGTGRVYLFYGETLSSRNASNADAIISGEAPGDELWGYHAEDVNDDGYADLIADSWRWEDAPRRIFIFYGGEGEAPITGTQSAADADLIFTGEAIDDRLRIDHGNVGDVNGDGRSDIILPATGPDGGVGHVYVFFGPSFESKSVTQADVVIAGEEVDGRFGSRLKLGDLNGDGITDIIVSSTAFDESRGRVYIFYGGSTLASGTEADADVKIDGEHPDDRLASLTVGDFDGDGTDDLVCSSEGYDGWRGRAYLFSGGNLTDMGAGSADVIIDGEDVDDSFPWDGQISDVTGDGVPELIFTTGSFDERRGRVYIFLRESFLPLMAASDADAIITGEYPGDRLTMLEMPFGDVNGDGIADIIASSRGYPEGIRRGRGYIFFGGEALSSKSAAEADVIIDGQYDDDSLELYQLLDVNGDGILDVIGTADEFSEILTRAGRIYLFFGGKGLASQSAADAAVKIDGEEANDLLGW